MSTYVTIDPQMISSPPHYIKGRKIEPIDVIEEWSFCHHLACVVKYVARAGRKNPILEQARLEDLKKAEWYLMREIEARPCARIPRLRRFPTAPEVIAKDWCLSSSLKEVISYLTAYQRLFCRFPLTKIICLKQALTHLGTEIKIWEGNDTRVNNTRVPANQSRHSSLLQQADFRGTNIIIFKGARAKDARVKGGEKPCCNKPE